MQPYSVTIYWKAVEQYFTVVLFVFIQFAISENLSSLALMFLYISLPSPAKQQREMTKFKACWRTGPHVGEVCIFLPYLNAVSINLVSAYVAHNVRVELIGIIAE